MTTQERDELVRRWQWANSPQIPLPGPGEQAIAHMGMFLDTAAERGDEASLWLVRKYLGARK